VSHRRVAATLLTVEHPDVLLDECLPVYDVSDAVTTVVEADVVTT